VIDRRKFLVGWAAAGFATPAVADRISDWLRDTRWVNPPPAGQLPVGVSHHSYQSKSLGKEVGYTIYLPPDYARSPGQRYPVIYNLHGAGGDELHGFEEARVLESGIRSGKLPRMIQVMPNGGKGTYYKDSRDGKWPAETMIMREVIPLIDSTYRTIANREGRAIEGFSMGGRGSTRLAIKYPDMFCSLFNQAGNVPHTANDFDPSKPDVYPNFYLGTDKARYEENDVFLLLKKNLAKIKDRLRIQVWCGTADAGHIATVREFHQALREVAIDHTYMEIEGLAHKRVEMVAQFADIWFDYHVESFRRSGALSS